ncbi:hypothetical protein Ancab_019580 [Ancistrocladus abbreviatus]
MGVCALCERLSETNEDDVDGLGGNCQRASKMAVMDKLGCLTGPCKRPICERGTCDECQWTNARVLAGQVLHLPSGWLSFLA